MDVDMQNIKKWVVIYPIYINSKKTLAEGRRINASKACENPTCAEIYDCCAHLKLPCAIESEKAYPRDFMQRGRVRVLLKREDGSLCNPAISSRKQLMLHVAELVPRHPGRTKKQEPASSSAAGASKSGKAPHPSRRQHSWGSSDEVLFHGGSAEGPEGLKDPETAGPQVGAREVAATTWRA
ncbi:UNVERIFIED_CONTAM: Signal recognition particle protein [Sesamum radiatum]|uniref:Signal recognition particle 19 kDa protein n=1 Tax=Sesamum radiatum TaxID=300843 RepID=A0AAW2L417_SESRA